jgi:nucleoside-diphosphate-sugar epimerase
MTMAYHRFHGIDIRIVRTFNTYGPRMRPDDGRVVSSFIIQALKGEPISVNGDGSQTRSFCYVDDQIEGQLRLFDSGYQLPVNIGNGTEFTIRELAEVVIDVTNSSSELSFRPMPVDDPRQRKPDLTVARRELDWEAAVPLREGVERTAEHFAEVLGL